MSRFTPPARPARVLLALVGVALGHASVAHAQNALGDGRALDANLSRTQGRINQRAGTLDEQLRFNNAVIYGQATGGKSFRGSVGYRASNEFNGSLGSDAIYSFQRDAAPSGYAAAGVRGSEALRYVFTMPSSSQVSRSFPNSANTTSFSSGAQSLGVLPRSGTVVTSQAVESAAAPLSALRSTTEYYSSQNLRPSTVGTRQDEYGAEYVARASPLTGVQWIKTVESPLGTNSNPSAVPGSNVPGSNVPGSNAPGSVNTASGTSSSLTPPTSQTPGAIGTDPASRGLPTPAPSPAGTEEPKTDPNRVNTEVPRVNNAVQDRLLTRVKTAYDSTSPTGVAPTTPNATAAGREAAPKDNSLDAQLALLRRSLKGEPDTDRDTGAIPSSLPGVRPDTSSVTTPTLPNSASNKPTTPAGRAPLPGAAPTTAQPGSGRSGDPQNPDPNAPTPSASSTRATTGQAMNAELMKALRAAADVRVDRLTEPDPSGKDPKFYASMMESAQSCLGRGRFFEAEERFTRALTALPGDPMARIGRVHAQLGAGLYVSAAANFRALIADHPEVIAVKYAPTLLPPPNRTTSIIEQLRVELTRGASTLGRDAALLMAYLGYQRGDENLLNSGLDELATHATPDDPADAALITLLRSAWQK